MGRGRISARIVLLSLLVVLTSVSGNYFLSVGMKRMGPGAGWPGPRLLIEPALLLGVLLLISWLLLRLVLLSGTEMSLALPITAGAAYVLTSLAGQFWLNETVTAWHQIGLSLIVLGVLLVGASHERRSGARGDPE